MLNLKIIFKTIGALLFLESIFIFLSLIVSLIYGESDRFAFAVTLAITFSTGCILFFAGKKNSGIIGNREGYIIVSLVWVIFSVFGSLPFIISKYIPTFTDAFFETASGFTTTGASILNDIESLPHGLLFWRSLTQWLGGMGMIVMSVAIMPMFGIGGMQLYAAEVPGPTTDKFHPRVKETAKRLWYIYSIFTAVETILLMIGGMNFFDALNHSFTTMATGGYSTKQASIAYWDSPFIHYVITLFMIIAGTNFTLSYFAFKFNFKKIWKDEEFRAYIGIILIFTTIITFVLYFTQNNGFEKSFRDSIFQVVSILTTTGYATADYLLWKPFAWVLILFIMFFGGSAGSTAGGIKISRIVILVKECYIEFKRILHPNAVIPVKFNKHVVSSSIVKNIFRFVLIYIFIFVVGILILSAYGVDFQTSIGAVLTSISNIGPGIGTVGPAANFYHLPAVVKWVLSFIMIIGRLELFTFLILLTPFFWKKF